MIDREKFLACVSSAGLPGASNESYELQPDDTVEAINLAARANLIGLLAALVADGVIRAPTGVAAEIHDAAIRRVISDMRIERWCGVVVKALDSENIPVRVLKGLASAYLDHEEPAHRSTSDVDLLVRGADMSRSVEILATLGYQRDLPERRRGFDSRFAKDVTLFARDLPEIDLHRTLVKGPHGLAVDMDEAFRDGEPLLLAGCVEARALSLPWRLLHSSLVVGAGDREPSMGMLRDLALQAHSSNLDPSRFERLVQRSRASDVVARAFQRAEASMGITLPWPGASERTAPRWWLRSYAAHGGTDVTTQVAAVAAIPWRDRGPYLWALAVPSKHYRLARSAAGRRSVAQMLVDSLRSKRRTRQDRETETG